MSRHQDFKGNFPRYIYYYLLSFKAEQFSKSTAVPTLNRNNLRGIRVDVPSYKEQKEIVVKIEELMRLCDELEARQQQRRASRVRLNNATLAPLNNAATLAPEEFEQACARLADNFATLYDSAETVSRLRSTILQLAVQGKLVPQDAKDELASVLLNKIKKRKDTLIKEKKIKPDRIGTNIVEDDSVSTLPKGWEWTRLNEILTSLRNGIAIPPQTVGNSRILRISALRPNAVNIEEYRYLPVRWSRFRGHKTLLTRCPFLGG